MESNSYKSVDEMIESLHKELPWGKKVYYVVYRFCNRVLMIPREIQ